MVQIYCIGELLDLTYIGQLIARIHPVVSVMKLKGHQYSYQGNVINFPQDIKEIARELPHTVEGLSSVITVKTTKETNPVEFQVRAEKVKTALRWLLDNNPLYHDIELSEDNVNALPDDGNVYNQLKGYTEMDGNEQVADDTNCTIPNPETSQKLNIDPEDPNNCANISHTDTNLSVDTAQNDSDLSLSTEDDIDNDNDTENYVIESTVPMIARPSEKAQLGSILDWPTIESTPINEFKTIGYIAMAYPCLFPY